MRGYEENEEPISDLAGVNQPGLGLSASDRFLNSPDILVRQEGDLAFPAGTVIGSCLVAK